MSKSTSTSGSKSSPRVTAADLIAARAKVIAEKLKQAASNPKSWLLLCLIGLSYMLWPAVAVGKSLAALVIFPDGMNRSGRSGGLVFQQNGRTRIFRKPALVQNEATSLARLNFASPSSGWNALTEDQRLGWINAIGFTSIDRFSRTFVLKGKALYVSLTKNLLTTGQVPIPVAPLLDSPLGNCNLVGTATAGVPSFNITSSIDTGISCATTVPAGSWMVLKVTAQVSPGRTRFSKSSFRVMKIFVPTDSLVAVDLLVNYTAQFGTLVANSNIGLEGYVINASGQASARIQGIISVGA